MRQALLDSNRRSERLLDSLLTLAKGERGVERFEPFDLGQVTRQEATAAEALAEEHAVTLEVTVPRPLRGGPALMATLVGNLLRNAVLYNRPGGTVEVRCTADALTVRNTGPRVPAEEVASLFEPFRRGRDLDRRAGRGEGLGLSIVAAVARAHGATTTATANPDGGLTIGVRLPAGDTPAG
ncbi:putative histidine kinase [Streptomyces sp. NBRC 110611]|nr:putative histidine kinase [Streptomyces sp. NBRC 110611]